MRFQLFKYILLGGMWATSVGGAYFLGQGIGGTQVLDGEHAFQAHLKTVTGHLVANANPVDGYKPKPGQNFTMHRGSVAWSDAPEIADWCHHAQNIELKNDQFAQAINDNLRVEFKLPVSVGCDSEHAMLNVTFLQFDGVALE